MEQNTNKLTDEQLLQAKKAVEEVLEKHKIVLVPIVIHYGDKTTSRIDIAPAPASENAAE
jgi:hypothetical protein